MSKAPAAVVDQAHRLVESTRLLPADDAAKVLEQLSGMAQAAQVERLAAAERSGEIRDSGCRTVRSFAQTILRRGVYDSDQLAQTARHLVDLPELAAAYRAGRVHTGNLRTIWRHRRHCGMDVLQAHEPQLVVLATRAGPKEITEFCETLADLNHPDRDEAKAKALGLRSVRIVKVGDLARLDAMLDPVVADQLKATLAVMTKAARQAEREAEKKAAEQEAARRAAQDGPGGAGGEPDYGAFGERRPRVDPRTQPERMADALEELLRRGMADTDVPTQGQSRHRPHAHVSVQLETLLGMGATGQALLHRFGVIGTPTAGRLACDALVRLIIKHGDQVLNVGRIKRVVSAAQHAALDQTHTTCVVPGCQIPFADCTIHHLWWWHLGGPTDLDLQLPVCGSHHIWLHEGGYSITREEGNLVFRDPHGRTIANLDHILATQLDLLHQQDGVDTPNAAVPSTAPPTTAPPTTGPPDDDTSLDPVQTGQAPELLDSIDGWPASPYRHGTWGWNGNNPGPPPGHAPPCGAAPEGAGPVSRSLRGQSAQVSERDRTRPVRPN